MSHCDELIDQIEELVDLVVSMRGLGCPADTGGDGNCGRGLCQVCHPEVHVNEVLAERLRHRVAIGKGLNTDER